MLLDRLGRDLTAEARAAPMLFADLAKVELYIAESYRTRAFIELLQNADDAEASRFVLLTAGTALLVGNDGRPFSPNDIEALCRSGASQKRRGSGTIGYRGIGFKSVAGIASQVDVVSGDNAFRFSKGLTRTLLETDHDVPLIRIPHGIHSSDDALTMARSLMTRDGLSTMFVLTGVENRVLAEEISAFDDTALLFLNNIGRIEIRLSGASKTLTRRTEARSDGYTHQRLEGLDEETAWLVAAAPTGCERVAFRFADGAIVPAAKGASVIHAFLPTSEFAGAFLKLNGDFSTDPSRKSVDWDDLSKGTFDRCVDVLARCLQGAVRDGVPLGIFDSLVSDAAFEGRFRKVLRDELLKRLDRDGLQLSGRLQAKPADVRLAPEWLAYEDYEALCEAVPHVPASLARVHPQLPAFLRWLGARALAIEDAIAALVTSSPSVLGCAQLICRFARRYRFELTDIHLQSIATSPILPTAHGRVRAIDYVGQSLQPVFLSYILAAAECDDVRFLLRRLKVTVEDLAPAPPKSETKANRSPATAFPAVQGSPFKETPAIKQWRSAEKNAAAWFSALVGVIDVKDVSQANVGYDLEIAFRDGRRCFAEVKSVMHFGEAVRLTNNEHATAFQYGTEYLLAIVVNGEPFDIQIIPDPIRRIHLEKRCEQWSWYADDYRDAVVDVFFISGVGADDDSAK